MCVRFSTFQILITRKRFEMSIWNSVHQRSSDNTSIVTIFKTIDGRFIVLWDFDCFEICGSTNFHEAQVIVLKPHTNIIYLAKTFGLEFGQNRLKRSNI